MLLEVPYIFQVDYTKITPLVDIIFKLQGTGDRKVIGGNHTYMHGTWLFNQLVF